MHIKITSENVGVRGLYEADIMSDHYEPGDVEFTGDPPTENVVAEVGEALCERYDWLEPADAEETSSGSQTESDESDGLRPLDSQASPDDSDGDTAGDEED